VIAYARYIIYAVARNKKSYGRCMWHLHTAYTYWSVSTCHACAKTPKCTGPIYWSLFALGEQPF